MSPSTTLEEDKNRKEIDETMYKGIIGSLLYLTTSQPDIMFNVYKCARFESATKESHLTTVKNNHHFIRDYVVKDNILLEFVNVEVQFAYIFTKPLLEERFYFL